MYKLDFTQVNKTALSNAYPILQRWLPSGKLKGAEYKALNPTRHDHKEGSFSVNIHNGKWADFATGDTGNGFISLTEYLFKIPTYEAAKKLASMLGMGV